MRVLLLSIIINVWAIEISAVAEVEQDIVSYEIPANAKKTGPIATRYPHQTFYNYFPADKEISRETQIGRETYDRSALIKRELFRNEKIHGVQKEWYTNGQEKLEAPYIDGVRHGVFKQWDENGRLLGQYEFRNGSGTVKVYDSTGFLIKEETFVNNVKNGWAMEWAPISQVWDIYCYVNGKIHGLGCEFGAGGVLLEMIWLQDGAWSGPNLKFSNGGEIVKKSWHRRGAELSEEDYAKAVQTDSSLPPYHANAALYKKEFLDEHMNQMIQKYVNMPRVKIPLEFDSEGNPIPAPTKP